MDASIPLTIRFRMIVIQVFGFRPMRSMARNLMLSLAGVKETIFQQDRLPLLARRN